MNPDRVNAAGACIRMDSYYPMALHKLDFTLFPLFLISVAWQKCLTHAHQIWTAAVRPHEHAHC